MAWRACRDLLGKVLLFWDSAYGESGDEIGCEAGECAAGDENTKNVVNESSSLLSSNGRSHDLGYMGCVNIKCARSSLLL